MSLISIVVTLLVVGVVLYVVEVLIPMDARIKLVIEVVVCLFVLLWVLQQFGLIPHVVSLK